MFAGLDRIWRAGMLAGLFIAGMLVVGCDDAGPATGAGRKLRGSGNQEKVADGKKTPVGDNIFLEIISPKRRRVQVKAEVCLREGILEELLTRKGEKEHEAILAADIDARKLHEALLLTSAKEGKPVQWKPEYRPPTGTTIRIELRYVKEGRTVTVPAQSWLREVGTENQLQSDWVFAGSMLVEDPLNPKAPRRYLANGGDVICVSNFEAALLDLPFKTANPYQTKAGYQAWTERIPPIGTPVTVILEPVLPKK